MGGPTVARGRGRPRKEPVVKGVESPTEESTNTSPECSISENQDRQPNPNSQTDLGVLNQNDEGIVGTSKWSKIVLKPPQSFPNRLEAAGQKNSKPLGVCVPAGAKTDTNQCRSGQQHGGRVVEQFSRDLQSITTEITTGEQPNGIDSDAEGHMILKQELKAKFAQNHIEYHLREVERQLSLRQNQMHSNPLNPMYVELK
ncbi:unnamed protein product [Amaranthus hypochondriacus]